MSKKDYIKFAAMFMDIKSIDSWKTWESCVLGTAKIFRSDNAAFRPFQFFTACGIETEHAGKMVTLI
jgi:hypothetical protein